jgi:hypothetical protein
MQMVTPVDLAGFERAEHAALAELGWRRAWRLPEARAWTVV